MKLRTARVPTLAYEVGSLTWPVKDPADVLRYDLDAAAWLADAADAIGDFSATPNGTGLTVAKVGHAAGVMTVQISGGTVGTRYAVTFHVTTTGGATLSRTVWLPVAVVSQPSGPLPSGAIKEGPAGPPGIVSVRADSTGWTADRT